MFKLHSLAVVSGLSLALAGCSLSGLPIGQEVVVQFDRSALGSGSTLPVSPTTESINGATTALRGILRAATDIWIQLEINDPQPNGSLHKTFWIPRDKVLLIQTIRFEGK